MSPTLAHDVPEGGEWIHEIKHDGYRTQIIIDGVEVRAFTRNGHDWSHRYPHLLAAARELRCQSAIIDGEAIVQDEQGRSDYHAFAAAMHARPEDIVLMGFDLLHLDGEDLRKQPLIERRARLQEMLGCHDPSCRFQFSEHVSVDGANFFEAVDAMGLEGIVSKKANSRYRSGRSKTWLKIKCFAEDLFTVIGIETGTGTAPTALLAREGPDGLFYAGSAMVTLAGPQRERFWRTMERDTVPAPVIAMSKAAGRWVKPSMRVRARYLKGSDKLRHATLTELVA
jgi:DNA ligase D-like protein (predicted ligase)